MEEIEKNEQDEDQEITFDKANKVNQLRDDFYSITFLGYVYRQETGKRNEILVNDDVTESKAQLFSDPLTGTPRKLTSREVARNFMSCIFIFIMQMAMIFTTFSSFTSNSTKEKDTDSLFQIYLIRFLCALALHMLIEPEVYQSI